jgi:hypothetical protein
MQPYYNMNSFPAGPNQPSHPQVMQSFNSSPQRMPQVPAQQSNARVQKPRDYNRSSTPTNKTSPERARSTLPYPPNGERKSSKKRSTSLNGLISLNHTARNRSSTVNTAANQISHNQPLNNNSTPGFQGSGPAQPQYEMPATVIVGNYSLSNDSNLHIPAHNQVNIANGDPFQNFVGNNPGQNFMTQSNLNPSDVFPMNMEIHHIPRQLPLVSYPQLPSITSNNGFASGQPVQFLAPQHLANPPQGHVVFEQNANPSAEVDDSENSTEDDDPPSPDAPNTAKDEIEGYLNEFAHVIRKQARKIQLLVQLSRHNRGHLLPLSGEEAAIYNELESPVETPENQAEDET